MSGTEPEVRHGDIVLYEPSPGHKFLGVVTTEPWKLGDHTTVVHLSRMEVGYGDFTGRAGRARVHAACVERLTVVGRMPTEVAP